MESVSICLNVSKTELVYSIESISELTVYQCTQIINRGMRSLDEMRTDLLKEGKVQPISPTAEKFDEYARLVKQLELQNERQWSQWTYVSEQSKCDKERIAYLQKQVEKLQEKQKMSVKARDKEKTDFEFLKSVLPESRGYRIIDVHDINHSGDIAIYTPDGCKYIWDSKSHNSTSCLNISEIYKLKSDIDLDNTVTGGIMCVNSCRLPVNTHHMTIEYSNKGKPLMYVRMDYLEPIPEMTFNIFEQLKSQTQLRKLFDQEYKMDEICNHIHTEHYQYMKLCKEEIHKKKNEICILEDLMISSTNRYRLQKSKLGLSDSESEHDTDPETHEIVNKHNEIKEEAKQDQIIHELDTAQLHQPSPTDTKLLCIYCQTGPFPNVSAKYEHHRICQHNWKKNTNKPKFTIKQIYMINKKKQCS